MRSPENGDARGATRAPETASRTSNHLHDTPHGCPVEGAGRAFTELKAALTSAATSKQIAGPDWHLASGVSLVELADRALSEARCAS